MLGEDGLQHRQPVTDGTHRHATLVGGSAVLLHDGLASQRRRNLRGLDTGARWCLAFGDDERCCLEHAQCVGLHGSGVDRRGDDSGSAHDLVYMGGGDGAVGECRAHGGKVLTERVGVTERVLDGALRDATGR